MEYTLLIEGNTERTNQPINRIAFPITTYQKEPLKIRHVRLHGKQHCAFWFAYVKLSPKRSKAVSSTFAQNYPPHSALWWYIQKQYTKPTTCFPSLHVLQRMKRNQKTKLWTNNNNKNKHSRTIYIESIWLPSSRHRTPTKAHEYVTRVRIYVCLCLSTPETKKKRIKKAKKKPNTCIRYLHKYHYIILYYIFLHTINWYGVTTLRTDTIQ